MSEITVPDQDELLKLRFALDVPSMHNVSAWTNTSKLVALPGIERWVGEVAVTDLPNDEAERPWRAFLFGLRGKDNYFQFGLPCNSEVVTNPTVGAGAGSGNSLPLSGGSGTIKAGSYLTVPLPSGRNRTVVVLSDVTLGGSPTATVEPQLTETPTFGVTVQASNPFCDMRAASSELSMEQVEGMGFFNFLCVEYP